MKKRVFITGGSGLLAINWIFSNNNTYNLILGLNQTLISVKNFNFIKVDLTTKESTKDVINTVKPDIVINTVGLTNVDKCEKFPENSKIANEIIPFNLASVCNEKNIIFVHISTDHLFDGRVKLASETEKVMPLNEYGKSKSKAEYFVKDNNPDSLIIRTNFFGWGTSYRQSFSDFIISKLKKSEKLFLFNDVYFTPIFVKNLIKYIYNLIEINSYGTFNIVSNDRLNKHEFGKKIAKRFCLDESLIIAKSIKDFPNLVLRPLDMSLSNIKLSKHLETDIGTVDSQINDLFNDKLNLDKINVILRK